MISHVFMTVEISSRGYTLNDTYNSLLFYCDRTVSVYVCVTCICAFFLQEFKHCVHSSSHTVLNASLHLSR